MNWLELIILAFALSIDSLAVSIATSPAIKKEKLVLHALIMSFSFGASHSLMILIGWFAGEKFISQISGLDHWIAFTLLTIIGGKMIWESFQSTNHHHKCPLKRLPTLCLATSIDALGVGISLALIQEPILRASITIGGIVLIVAFIGILMRRQLHKYFGHYAELIGGLILIAIGVKILFEHLLKSPTTAGLFINF